MKEIDKEIELSVYEKNIKVEMSLGELAIIVCLIGQHSKYDVVQSLKEEGYKSFAEIVDEHGNNISGNLYTSSKGILDTYL